MMISANVTAFGIPSSSGISIDHVPSEGYHILEVATIDPSVLHGIIPCPYLHDEDTDDDGLTGGQSPMPTLPLLPTVFDVNDAYINLPMGYPGSPLHYNNLVHGSNLTDRGATGIIVDDRGATGITMDDGNTNRYIDDDSATAHSPSHISGNPQDPNMPKRSTMSSWMYEWMDQIGE